MKKNLEEREIEGKRGIYISEFYSQKSVRSKCTYLSQSLFPRTISTQFTDSFFFRF